jgi:hypothetical protein
MRRETWRKRLRLHGRERGQALVEFSLILIVFLTLFMGIFDGVRLIESWVTVQHAAREGARFAITGRTACKDDGEGGWEFIDRDACIVWAARNATEGIPGGGEDADPSEVAVTYRAWDFLEDEWDTSAEAGKSGKPCDQLEVKVQYSHHFFTPLIKVIVPGGIKLTGYQRMTNEPWGPCESDDGTDLDD